MSININKLIIDTLKSFNIQIRENKYSGPDSTYITFFEINNYDEDYSEDVNETEVHSLQIDLWSDRDVTQLKKEIKMALKAVFDDVTFTSLYEDDTKTHHISFRCYYYEEVL